MDFWLCFTCSAHYSELLPGDLGRSAVFLKELIDKTLDCYHLNLAVVAVELDFILPENAYSVHITFRYDELFEAIPSNLDTIKLDVEIVVSHAMLQSFWEVDFSEC